LYFNGGIILFAEHEEPENFEWILFQQVDCQIEDSS